MTIPTRASIRVTLLLGTGLLLAACGGTTAPASSPAASVAAKASAPVSAAASAKPVASAAASVSAKPAASGAASAKPAASALTSKAYSFEAQDYSFNGPATIEGGLVTLQLKNTGKEPHHLQLLKFNTGVTMDQLTAAIATGDETAIFKLVSFPGGVGTVDPNGNAEIIANLSEGQYALACFVQSPDGIPHLAKGMVKPLTVTAPTASAAPSVQAGQTVTMKDFAYDGPTSLSPGRTVIRIDNTGPQVHEMNVLKLAPGKQVQDVVNFFKAMAGPPAGASAKPAASAPAKPAASAVGGASAAAKPAGGPPPFSSAGGANAESQNVTEWAVVNLDAGDYVLICNIPDPASGQPHSALGMVKQISVK